MPPTLSLDAIHDPFSTHITPVTQELHTSPYAHRRWNASQTIGSLGFHSGEKHVEARLEGAEALSRTLVHKESENYLRWQTSQSLAQLGSGAGHKSATSLAQCLLQKKPGQPGAEVFVRCGVARSIGKLGEAAKDHGVFALVKALETERQAPVRQRAAASLGELGEFAGSSGIQALVAALRRDEDVIVRFRICEALGQIGRRIGDTGAAALALALGRDKDAGVRLRAAASLGLLADLPGEAGVEALLRAWQKDDRMHVRDQASDSLDRILAACTEALDEVSGSTHAFERGRSAKIIGRLGARLQDLSVEVLAVNLINDYDVHVRRRVAEAFDALGPACSDLGVAALSRSVSEDSDVYVQWIATQALGSIGLTAQPAAAERLQQLLEEDAKRRPPPPKPPEPEEPAEPPEPPAEQALPVEAPVEEAPVVEVCSPVEEAPVERVKRPEISGEDAAQADAGELGNVHGNIALDSSRAAAAFKRLSSYGEISADPVNLVKLLKVVGHQSVDSDILDGIIQEELSGRSCLDQEDFLQFVESYESRRHANMEEQFKLTDTDGSGQVSAEELEVLLKRMGITPGTGVVSDLIMEVIGERGAEVSFDNYIKIHTILNERAGFTRAQYGRLRGIFMKHDGDKDSRISAAELRAALAGQGFKLKEEETEKFVERVVAARVVIGSELQPEEQPEAGTITEIEYLSIARAVREAEAKRALKAVNEDEDEEADEEVVNVVEADELPELLYELGHAPLLPENVQEFMQACGYKSDRQLTFEDLIPMLERIRMAEGFPKADLDEIADVFRRHDADGSDSISGLELERAIRWLGFPASFEQIQAIVELFDIDNTGELDNNEFMQVVGRLRKKEIDKCVECVKDAESKQVARLDDDLVAWVPTSHLRPVLESLGHAPLHSESVVLTQAIARSRRFDEDDEEPPGEGEGAVNMWGLARLVREYRCELREIMRKKHGYSEREVQELRDKFRENDPDDTGSISDKRLGKLLGTLFEGSRQSRAAQAKVVEVLKEVDEDGSGTIEFHEFLGLMRIVQDELSKQKQDKERRAVEETKFSRTELKEFREVFHSFDTDGSGDMDFDELQQMVAVIVGGAVMGVKGERELKEVLRQVDEDGGGVLDFPEFLHVIRVLVDQNFLGINDKLAPSAAEPS